MFCIVNRKITNKQLNILIQFLLLTITFTFLLFLLLLKVTTIYNKMFVPHIMSHWWNTINFHMNIVKVWLCQEH